jgi:P-type Mg2+ transporter
VLALGPWGGLFGFTTTSMALMATIVVITAAYLAAAEAAKQVALQSPLNHRA